MKLPLFGPITDSTLFMPATLKLLSSQLLGDKSVGGLANCVVFGTRGRLGRMLRMAWDLDDVTLDYAPRCDLRLPNPVVDLDLKGKVVICLSGVTPASAKALDRSYGDNTTIAQGMINLAHSQGAKGVLLFSSIAVYGGTGAPWSESARLAGTSDYAISKIRMEEAVRDLAQSLALPVTVLRLGNVAGADAALGGWSEGAQMDVFSNGTTPQRSYIGPITLARVLLDLAGLVEDLPEVLNVAQRPVVAMGDLLNAAGRSWTARPAPPSALADAQMDISKLLSVLGDLEPATPQGLAAEVAAL